MCSYLVVNGDLRVGVSLIERFDLTDVLLHRELHHSEHHRHLRWQLGELQLTDRENKKRRTKGERGMMMKRGKREREKKRR